MAIATRPIGAKEAASLPTTATTSMNIVCALLGEARGGRTDDAAVRTAQVVRPGASECRAERAADNVANVRAER